MAELDEDTKRLLNDLALNLLPDEDARAARRLVAERADCRDYFASIEFQNAVLREFGDSLLDRPVPDNLLTLFGELRKRVRD